MHRHRSIALVSDFAAALAAGPRPPYGRPSRRSIASLVVVAAAVLLPAQVLAQGGSSDAEGQPRISLPVEPGSTVEGLVEVDGHDIYARCAGEGSPTVLYFTGWAPDLGKRGVAIAPVIENALGPGFRVCSYERRNTGRSESVEGTQSPQDVIADVDGFLAVLDEEGPFVLLGASFGGQVAAAYAVAHPERVAGVVLLDASTGVEYEVDEAQSFQGMCLEANRQADAWDTLERLDNCHLAEWIRDHREQEPDVPLLYLAAEDPHLADPRLTMSSGKRGSRAGRQASGGS